MKLAFRLLGLFFVGLIASAGKHAEEAAPRALANSNENRFFSIIPADLKFPACVFRRGDEEAPAEIVNPLEGRVGRTVDLNASVKALGGLFAEALKELGVARLEKEMSPALLERLVRARGKRAKDESDFRLQERLAQIEALKSKVKFARVDSAAARKKMAEHPAFAKKLEELVASERRLADSLRALLKQIGATADAAEKEKLRERGSAISAEFDEVTRQLSRLREEAEGEFRPLDGRRVRAEVSEIVGDPAFDRFLSEDPTLRALIERNRHEEELEELMNESLEPFENLSANEVFYSTWLARLLREMPADVRVVFVVQNGEPVGLSYLRFKTAPQGMPPFVVQELDPTDGRKLQMEDLKKRFKIAKEVGVESLRWQECESPVLDAAALESKRRL